MSSDTAVCYPRGSLASQTYYLRLTYVGSGGETTGSTEQAVACGSSTIVEVSSPLPSYGAVGYNVYISTTSGSGWTLQNDYPLYIGQPWFMPTAGLRSGGSALPGSNTTSIRPPLYTSISGYNDAHHVTLAANAGSTVTNGNFGYGTDNATAINNALTACRSIASLGGATNGGGRVVLSQKQYLINSADLTVPSGCELGNAQIITTQQQTSSSLVLNNVPAIVLNPSYRLACSWSRGRWFLHLPVGIATVRDDDTHRQGRDLELFRHRDHQ